MINEYGMHDSINNYSTLGLFWKVGSLKSKQPPNTERKRGSGTLLLLVCLKRKQQYL